ncbi:MAG: metallophosphoesterase family protein [Candidatus Saganbacteria bacterium]|nr:metallophosphoesterase family protein [Candidatus Saganbacteria bacterium]
MLYGIISDIHGNLEALETVINKLKEVDKIVCVGDIVGYGPNPNECVEKIRELNIPSVGGNHEKAVTQEFSMENFNSRAKQAVLWTQKVIAPENLEYLKQLPLILEEDGFELVHGSLNSPLEQYIYSIPDSILTFQAMTKPLCFTGHTHKPLFVALKKDGNYDGRLLQDDDELLVDDYEKIIINVGSVGQPRDKDPRASYGIYDSKTSLFGMHRVAYDISKVQEKMQQAQLPQPLIDRLSFGR